jgi:ribosome biogenesis GTPase
LWGGDKGVQDAFEDIAELAAQCRFNDCKHEVEPDCAVRAALDEGRLDKARYNSYLKLQREIAYQARKNDQTALMLAKEKAKKLSNEQKRMYGHRTKR